MSSARKFLDRVSRGDIITADYANTVSSRVSQNSSFGAGSQNAITNSSGTFVRNSRRKPTFWTARLSEDLVPATSVLTGPSDADCDIVIVPSSSGDLVEITLGINSQLTVYNYDDYAVYFDDEIVSGEVVSGRHIVLWPGKRTLYGIAQEEILSEATGTVALYGVGIGAGTSPGIEIEAYNITSVTAEIDTRVEITPDVPEDRWVLKPLECP